ncbi:MAG: bifunctional 2-polyprenyl-6-hydroxyphenol methylase/3-demethylubiquinol 3-O-methyltransferase UbiG [Gammaproteobacteria bacterium]|jgi:2-polyprenyl-6-hydroxyphenyl methylase/3-demethylubiquinone-9 3-methyltransferase|nr:bifunctional 2-polyprenyl-6-hydroxyphenol methylase/3-demethylubiquinol 3-O-methyltransferase UbiG [Gammaproteobacteria bacterium]
MYHADHNVDQAEISKFEAMAARWWDPHSEFRPLHELNPVRLDFIDQAAGLAGKKVLDVGCGGGILAEGMATRGAQVTGIDLGEMPLRVAELHTLETGVKVHYRRISAEALAMEAPASFDLVTCMEMLEHVPDPGSIIAACARLVKPGGQIFFSTLNRNPKSYLLAIIGAEYLLRWLPPGTHDYARFIRPAELGRWLRAAGLELNQLMGMTYHPLLGQYRLDPRDLDVNYLAACRRPGNG